ncbi:MAG: hypothetical protein U0105_18165 [Candidatus Obscuribacterales bacterium]
MGDIGDTGSICKSSRPRYWRHPLIAALTLLATSLPAAGYQFDQSWEPFPSGSPANAVSGEPASAAAAAAATPASFLPTGDCRFQRISDEHLALQQGAILVRAGKKPVFVSQNVGGQKIVTRITGGALTMISTAGGNCLVLNLTDKCCGALVLYPPSADGKGSSPVHVSAGMVAEVYPAGGKTLSGEIASGTVSEKPCAADLTLLLSTCDYAKALVVWNLEGILTTDDLERIAKKSAPSKETAGTGGL